LSTIVHSYLDISGLFDRGSSMQLFSYMDYRQFLQDYYEKRKSENPSFSFRMFSRMAGLGGDTYLRMVMKGLRNLSPSSIRKFTHALKLNCKEEEYFENLVLFNQAKTERDRDVYFDRLIQIKPLPKLQGIEKDQLEYLKNKNYVVIREMVALPHFQEDPEWIASNFRPPLKPREVTKTIEALIRLELLKRDEDGKLKHSKTMLATLPQDYSLEIYNYHRSIISEAKDKVLNSKPDLREVVSITVPAHKESILAIKKALKEVQEKIMHYASEQNVNYDDVYQINFQLYPLTHTQGNKGGNNNND